MKGIIITNNKWTVHENAGKSNYCSDTTDITYSKQENQAFGNQQAMVGY